MLRRFISAFAAIVVAGLIAAPAFAVVGASRDPEKYGARVLESYRRHQRTVFPVNPREKEIQGLLFARIDGLRD